MNIHIQAGRKAKANGQSFENIFEMACLNNDVAVTPIPDSCRRVSAKKIIQIKSPYDFTISHHGRSAMLDTKTQDGSTFPFSKIDEDQVLALLPHEKHGVPAGYVVWLREINQVIFIAAGFLQDAIGKRGSFRADSQYVKLLGSVETFSPTKIFG